MRSKTLAPLLLPLFLLQAGLVETIRLMETAWVEPPSSRTLHWNPDLFKTLTFGFWPAVVDGLWLRTLQDTSLTHVDPGVFSNLYYDLDLAIRLDPAFYEIYVYGAPLIAIARADGIGARNLLLEGERFRTSSLPTWPGLSRERFWKNEWRVPAALGYVYLFELEQMAPAVRYYRLAAQVPSAPEYIKKLERKFETVEGQIELGMRFLGSYIEIADQPEIKKKFYEKRDKLSKSYYVYDLNRRFKEFLRSQRSINPAETLSQRQVQKLWNLYQRKTGTGSFDPWGGKFSVDSYGKIQTTTAIENVLGFEFGP